MITNLDSGFVSNCFPCFSYFSSPQRLQLQHFLRFDIPMTANPLTHFAADGQAHMVDVGEKSETRRQARAAGRILMRPETLALIESGSAKKGDVLGVARIAAIQGAKRTADLIPL